MSLLRRFRRLVFAIMSAVALSAAAVALSFRAITGRWENPAAQGGGESPSGQGEPQSALGGWLEEHIAHSRLARWLEDHSGVNARLIRPFMEHRVPKTGWLAVLGSATLFAFILQVVTGITLALAYVPSAGQAYQTLQFITNDATLGRLLRGIHFFGASAMVVLIGVHLIRVFLTGSYKFPREINWMAGVVLLFLTLAMAFSGEVLRWDQNAVWGLVVAVEALGRVPVIGFALAHFLLAGGTVGAATLSRFFSYHVFFIPALIFGFIGFHLYLVLRNGESEPPRAGETVDPKTYRARYEKLLREHGEPFWPNAGWKDAAFGAFVILLVVLLALIIGPAPLVGPPDPAVIQATPRPDWEFLWFFAALALIPPPLEPWVIIGGPLVFGLVIFLLPLYARRGERSPLRRPWAVGIVLVAVMMVGILTWYGVRAPWSPAFAAQPLPAQVVNSADPQVIQGAHLFYQKGCEYCHMISGHGGQRGPNLTTVGDRLTTVDMQIRILNGGYNMPAYGSDLSPDEVNQLIAFLQSRKAP